MTRIGLALFFSAFTPFSLFAQSVSIDAAEKRIVDLYQSGQMFDRANVLAVRKALADYFENKHYSKITEAFGSERAEIEEWFGKTPGVRDKLYTAIDDNVDNVLAALKLYREIWVGFPKHREAYQELAIAISVVWDKPQAVYNYRQHYTRVSAKLTSEKPIEAIDNFRYYTENEKGFDPGRIRNTPWELLIYVVDHSTPEKERAWARDFYKNRSLSRSWHQSVPYDMGLLNAEMSGNRSGNTSKLYQKDYTLVNILNNGGVCTHQADFATRTAKSAGIPAVYCTGMSAYRGGHAWWMYTLVDKPNLNNNKFTYTLNSDGRYQGFIKDAFYVGNCVDPQSGKRISDREMEQLLHTVATDRTGKRMVDMIMKLVPVLDKNLSLKVSEKVRFMDRCMRVCPVSPEPWDEIIQLVQKNELAKEERAFIQPHLRSALTHFKLFPDLLQKIYSNLISELPYEEKVKSYGEAMVHFEKIGRADLACDARLKITSFYEEKMKLKLALDGLILTLNKFPTEGRYVPIITKKIEDLSEKEKGYPQKLSTIYLDLIPRLKTYYGQENPEVTLKLYSQAINFMTKNGLKKDADQLKSRVGVK